MPYYAGDYYAGDPGFLSDLVAKAKGALAPIGKEILTGIVGGGKAMPGLPPALAGLVKPGPKLPGAALPALAKAAAAAAPAEEARHYRRMNVLNPRALRRSMRRVQGFARFASKTMTFTKRHKLKKHRRR